MMPASDLQNKPSNWNPGVQYTDQLVYSSAVTADLQKLLHTPTVATSAWPKVGQDLFTSTSRLVSIQPCTRQGHPAKGQHGLFAAKHLPSSAFVLSYVGLVHANHNGDTDPESNHDLSFDRELGLSLDATNVGNQARYINDYRGVAEAPNAEFQDCWMQVTVGSDQKKRWERRIGIFVLSAGQAGKRAKGIKRGEEILVNYGSSFWRERRDANRDARGALA